ncbi:MAG: PepSY-associated TM helix domain-containing protein [Pseudomonadales bacterium]
MKINRRRWYRWHSFSGLSLSILLFFISATGTLAVLSHEIDWLFNSALRIAPQSETAELSWAALYGKASHAYPNARISSITAPINTGFAAEVLAVKPDGKRFRIYLNPYTNQVTGIGRWMNWQRYLRQFHRHLMLPTTLGVTLVSSTSLLLLISFLTGIVNYRRWWKGFASVPRKNNKRLFWGDMHRLLGVWSLAFILLISVTGLWYLGERWGLAAQYPDNDRQVMPDGYDEQWREQITPQLLQSLQDKVTLLYPTLVVRQLQLPDFSLTKLSSTAILFRGQADAVLVRDRANHVAFDIYTEKHLAIRKGTSLDVHVRLSEAADPLHFGTFWGLKSKIAWFLFGLVLTALIVTGIYIYSLRMLKETTKQSSLSGPKKRLISDNTTVVSLKALAWRGMGCGAWVGIVLVVMCLVLAVLCEVNS